jgi:hypothetical protein
VAIYGGHDIAVSDNLVSDTLTEGAAFIWATASALYRSLRAEGSATLSGVDAAGVLDPSVRTCGAFRLDWKRSTNSGPNSSSTRGC